MSTRNLSDNPQDIYAGPGDGRFFSPFRVRIDPMKHLLLINFEKDPDEVYLGFEPQLFDDPIHGQGLIVLAYRIDGKIDVYHQPGVTLQASSYSLVGKGLESMQARPMQGACFHVWPNRLEAAFAFEDNLGRLVDVVIREDGQSPRKAFDMLAPLGSGSENPLSLPLFWMYDFGFVRRSGTQVRIEIAGKPHRVDPMPVPVAGERVFFSRFSADPLIMHWNPNTDEILKPIPAEKTGEVRDVDAVYSLVEKQGHPEIERMRAGAIEFCFTPPVPDIACLKDGARADGEFTISGESSIGRVCGKYSVWRTGQQVHMRVHPAGGWQPNEPLWSVKLIFALVGVFRNWPKTYEWNATLTRNPSGELHLNSHWQRIRG